MYRVSSLSKATYVHVHEGAYHGSTKWQHSFHFIRIYGPGGGGWGVGRYLEIHCVARVCKTAHALHAVESSLSC